MTNRDQLVELYKKYNLVKEDMFKSPQGWVIISRSGIDKIQSAAGISIGYEVISYTPRDEATVKAVGIGCGKEIETFGSASIGGFGKGTTKSLYVIEMAEKRAMSRAVLKLAGFYELGVFGEDESEDFKKSKVDNEFKT